MTIYCLELIGLYLLTLPNLINFIISFVASLIAVFFTVDYIFKRNAKLEFEGLLGGVYDEINHNEKQLKNFPEELDRKIKFWCILKRKELAKFSKEVMLQEEIDHIDDYFGWIQKKTIITSPNQRKWLYQYLSDNAYNALIHSAHSLSYQRSKLIRESEENWAHYSDLNILSRYYYNCKKFSDETQFIEDVLAEVSEKIFTSCPKIVGMSKNDFLNFRNSIMINCRKNLNHESIDCFIQIGENEYSVPVFRMPLYFDFLNFEKPIPFPGFVNICKIDMNSIFERRGGEIKSYQEQIQEKDGVKLSKSEWIKEIS